MEITTQIPKAFTVQGTTSKATYKFYQSDDGNYWMIKPVFKDSLPVKNLTIRKNITKKYYEDGYLSTQTVASPQ